MTRFRHYVRLNPFRITLREDEAAPAGGTPESPDNPSNTTNKYHFDALKQQLGIEDDELQAALESDSVQLWKCPDFSSKWGFMVVGPVNASLQERPDGSFNVTFQLRQKRQMSGSRAFIRPYEQGQRPMYYEGPVDDKMEIMRKEELADLMTAPLAHGGAPMGGGMGGMGGAPMGGMPGGM